MRIVVHWLESLLSVPENEQPKPVKPMDDEIKTARKNGAAIKLSKADEIWRDRQCLTIPTARSRVVRSGIPKDINSSLI
ncbi:hypothetical protein [Picosynechococcus sp. NKBG15041c]|uniref:hypothetical protein n=1 Tax=Picosynechococcus sp. NKBG15041c TaxID=1407650 RepID=UPI00130D5FCE|nr:hypothetical protein [Picosynechococcus sp. NKBG15041c]